MNTTDSTDPVAATLRHTFAADASHLGELRERLAVQADREGVLDVAVRTVDSPVGRLLVATTDAGVVRIAFEREGHDMVIDQLARTVGRRLLRSDTRTENMARQLGEYFDGNRHVFDVPVDLRLAAGFRHTVLEALRRVDYGTTETYTALARSAGNERAVRAAASACATNPVPVVVPCHRIVRRDGTLGGYRGGIEAKSTLLHLEGARAQPDAESAAR